MSPIDGRNNDPACNAALAVLGGGERAEAQPAAITEEQLRADNKRLRAALVQCIFAYTGMKMSQLTDPQMKAIEAAWDAITER